MTEPPPFLCEPREPPDRPSTERGLPRKLLYVECCQDERRVPRHPLRERHLLSRTELGLWRKGKINIISCHCIIRKLEQMKSLYILRLMTVRNGLGNVDLLPWLELCGGESVRRK